MYKDSISELCSGFLSHKLLSYWRKILILLLFFFCRKMLWCLGGIANTGLHIVLDFLKIRLKVLQNNIFICYRTQNVIHFPLLVRA